MLWLAAAATVLLGADAAPRPKLLTPPEILERLTTSQTTYEIGSTESAPDVPPARYADLLWPASAPVREFPQVVAGPAGPRVIEATISPDTVRLIRATEPLFQAGKYEAAAAEYEKALAKDPGSFLLLSHLGDCQFERGRYDEALRFYDRAIAALPTDHRLWWYKGQTLAQLGRRAEALDAFTEALVVRPRWPRILEWLDRNAGPLGIQVQKDSMPSPRAFVRRDGDKVRVLVDPKRPSWLAFAACKAMWMAEPSRRKEATGSEAPAFTSFEERECLAALLWAYEKHRKEKGFAPDPELERLERIVEGGLLDGFILYELLSRVAPSGTLVLGDDAKAEVRRYVRTYVLAPRGG